MNWITGNRISCFLPSSSLLQNVSSVTILPTIRSGHRIVEIQIKMHLQIKRPGYKKFNNFYTNLISYADKSYVEFNKSNSSDFQVAKLLQT